MYRAAFPLSVPKGSQFSILRSATCSVHQENLAFHRRLAELANVKQDISYIVHSFESKFLNSRLFEKLRENLNAKHNDLIYFSNGRWLSRVKVQESFVILRKDVRDFLMQNKHAFADKIVDQECLLLVAYLFDIFPQLNIFNQSLQEPNILVVDVSEKQFALKKKVEVVEEKNRVSENDMFISDKFLEDMNENEMSLDDIQIVMQRHLTSLIKEFDLTVSRKAKKLE